VIPLGKCPNQNCAQIVSHADLDHITLGNKLVGPLYNGVSAHCPRCKTVLGVVFDPISQRNDIVKQILEGLGVKVKKR